MQTKSILRIIQVCLFLILAKDGFGLPVLEDSSSNGGADWYASDGGSRNASTAFLIDENTDTLSITLTNLGKTSVPNEVLTGFYFSTTGIHSFMHNYMGGEKQ